MKSRIDNPFSWPIVLAVMFLGLSITVGLRTTSPSRASQVSGASAMGSTNSSLTVAHELSDAFATVAETVNPSIVTIFTETEVTTRRGQLEDSPYREFFDEDFFEQFLNDSENNRKQMGLGSGVIVDRDGIILTNNHVVGDAHQVNVRLMDGRVFEAKVMGADPQTDLAVISIDAHNLVPAELGDSDQSRVGEWVLAIGSPFSANLDHTVTSGIISAKGRSGVGLSHYEDFLQTDAAISPGNSGGALVDLNGRVIGINTAIATHDGRTMGIGFAIPANLAKKVMADIVERGAVERGWLGVHIQTLSPELAQAFGLESSRGAVVTQVQKGSPADEAGLKPADIVVAFEGREIDNAVELSTQVAGTSPRTRVDIEVVRDGSKKHFHVTLAELNPAGVPVAEGESRHNEMGIAVSGITPDLTERYGLVEDQKGVVITDVAAKSMASEAGLRAGDVVLELNREPVQTVGDFEEAMRGNTADGNALFYVQRDDARVFVACETQDL